MKKIILFAALMIGANNVSAQALSQGTILVDAYYGFPNLYKTILSATYADLGDNLRIHGAKIISCDASDTIEFRFRHDNGPSTVAIRNGSCSVVELTNNIS